MNLAEVKAIVERIADREGGAAQRRREGSDFDSLGDVVATSPDDQCASETPAGSESAGRDVEVPAPAVAGVQAKCGTNGVPVKVWRTRFVSKRGTDVTPMALWRRWRRRWRWRRWRRTAAGMGADIGAFEADRCVHEPTAPVADLCSLVEASVRRGSMVD